MNFVSAGPIRVAAACGPSRDVDQVFDREAETTQFAAGRAGNDAPLTRNERIEVVHQAVSMAASCQAAPGTAANRAFVYGCCGFAKISWVAATSTTRPLRITAMHHHKAALRPVPECRSSRWNPTVQHVSWQAS